jgi:RimJ/RimL family protein N-acetyltransferase
VTEWPRAPFDLPAGPLLLRPWRADDLDAAWAALQDPEVRRWNDAGTASRASAAGMLARRRDWSGGDHASGAVVAAGGGVGGSRAGGQLLGSVSLHSVDLVQGDAEIGYWTVPAARGRGVAPRAVDAAVGWAFAALPLERVELLHAVENAASGRVAARAGFTCEGRMRRSYRYGDGVRHDELLWSRLPDDPPPSFPPTLGER